MVLILVHMEKYASLFHQKKDEPHLLVDGEANGDGNKRKPAKSEQS